jgi:serine/threonine-protein kinase
VGKILKRVISGAITPVRLVAPHIPKNIVDLIDRMLTVDRDRRPSLQEVGKVLARHGNVTFRPFGPPVSLPPPPPLPNEPAAAPAPDGGAATLPRSDLEAASTIDARHADAETAPTLSSAPPPASANGVATAEGGDDGRLFEAALTPLPGRGAAPAERGSEPPAPPAMTWVTVVVCALVIAVGSALILIWQRP